MSKTGSSRVPNAGGTSKGGLVVRATYPRPRDWNGLRGNTAGKCLSFFKEQKKAACVSVFPNENGTTNGQTTCPTSSPTPAPHAAQDAPRTSREPGPHFRIRLYTRQYDKEPALPVPVFGKCTRELSGHTEENLGVV